MKLHIDADEVTALSVASIFVSFVTFVNLMVSLKLFTGIGQIFFLKHVLTIYYHA